jgi:hypothetical protein
VGFSSIGAVAPTAPALLDDHLDARLVGEVPAQRIVQLDRQVLRNDAIDDGAPRRLRFLWQGSSR